MNKLRSNLNSISLVLLGICSFFIFTNNVNAYNAGPGTGSIGVVCAEECGSDNGKLQLVGYSGEIGISVWSRPFNFIRSDNNSNLVQGASIPRGTQLTFSPYGSAFGSWWISGGSNDTPDMDNRRYSIPAASLSGISPGWTIAGGGFDGGDVWGIGFRRPASPNPESIVGGGGVSCTGGICTANSVGSGSITLKFPAGSVEANVRPKYPNQWSNCNGNGNLYDCGQENEQVSYSAQYFTYNFTIFNPNTKPVASCIGVDNINYTNVRVKWTYSDSDGDAQSFARVQVSNVGDTGFSSPIINNQVFGSSIREYTVNSLNHSTTYNYRVRVNDGKDPSNWVNCGTFQTKVNQAPTLNYTSTTNISYNTATANWTYSDPDGDPQIRYELKVRDLGGGEDFSRIVNSSSTNASITGLKPGTTYIPSIRVENDPNGWTGWINGPQFTTLVNNPPNLDQLSCEVSSEATDYERARLEWNYTGTDDTGDELVLKARWKRPEDGVWTLLDLPYNTRTGSRDISGLISGYTYQIEVSLNDNRNSHLGDRWKGCGTVQTADYPLPNVDFSLQSGPLTAQNGDTLTVKTGDLVNAIWNINNTEGVSSCSVNTSGGDGVNLFTNNDAGFNGTLSNTAPNNPDDLTYQVKLSCAGKPAREIRNVTETINLKVESYPTVSCSVRDGKKSVSAEDSEITIDAIVSNTNNYRWKLKRYSGDSTIIEEGPISSLSFSKNLNYSGLPFGRYQPSLEVINSGNGKSYTTTCSPIVNLGDSKIKEVNP